MSSKKKGAVEIIALQCSECTPLLRTAKIFKANWNSANIVRLTINTLCTKKRK